MSQLTQHGRMIRELQKAGNRGVPNYRWPQMGILSYSRRLFELKHDGHQITMERDYVNGHASNVYRYFLLDKPVKRHWYNRNHHEL